MISEVVKRPKPGIGWKKLSSVVYEHSGGTRIHVSGGLVKTPDRKCHWIDYWAGTDGEGRRQLAISGGNRRRALMCWANILMSEQYDSNSI